MGILGEAGFNSGVSCTKEEIIKIIQKLVDEHPSNNISKTELKDTIEQIRELSIIY